MNIKVGDWVKSLITEHDVREGKEYLVIDEVEGFYVMVRDDVGESYPLYLHPQEFELLSEPVDKLRQIDKPDYYQILPEYQVLDINKALLDKIQDSDFDLTLNEAGWYQQAMQYFMRFFAKNGIDDLEKGVYAMGIVIESLKERQEND